MLGSVLFASDRPAAVERLTDDGLVKRRPSWSPDGKRLAFVRDESGDAHIWQYVMDAGKPGSALRVTRRETPDYDAAFMRDGKRLVLVTVAQSGTQGNLDVAVVAAEGGEPKTIVGDVGGKLAHAEWPSPSPDGKRLAYSSTHEGNQEVYVAKIDGTDPVRLTQSPGVDAHPCWARDGRSIVFATDRWGGLELAIVRDDGTGLKRLTRSPGLDDYPAVSPDGKRLAFATNRDGNLEVYVSALDGSRPANVSMDAGVDTMPTWTPDGRGVTFVSARAGGFDVYTAAVAP